MEHGVFQGADVEMEDLEVQGLEQAHHFRGLARGSPARERPQQQVGPRDPRLHLRRRRAAARRQLPRLLLVDAAAAAGVGGGGGGAAGAGGGGVGVVGGEGARAWGGWGAAGMKIVVEAAALVCLECFEEDVELADEVDGAADDGGLVAALHVQRRRQGTQRLEVLVHLPPPVPLHRDVRHRSCRSSSSLLLWIDLLAAFLHVSLDRSAFGAGFRINSPADVRVHGEAL